MCGHTAKAKLNRCILQLLIVNALKMAVDISFYWHWKYGAHGKQKQWLAYFLKRYPVCSIGRVEQPTTHDTHLFRNSILTHPSDEEPAIALGRVVCLEFGAPRGVW
jgi:hypothetical protein